MDSSNDFLTGGDELFYNPRYLNHYYFMLKDYKPNLEKPIAFFLSCSKHKPFSNSPYRRVFTAMLSKTITIKDKSQIYTVSEPAIIIPEELDETNIINYDFPPDRMEEEGRQVFVERLAALLPKLFSSHKIFFYILPKHHRAIFEDAIEKLLEHSGMDNVAEKVIYAPPLMYNLPKARNIIEEGIKRNL